MILQIHHAQITIPEGEEGKAREFYCSFLGLKEIPKPESLQGRGGFWLDVGGFQIHIGIENNFDRTKTKAHVAYLVDDLEKCREKLSAKDIKILQGVSIPGCNRFEFRDPFGNRVEFLEEI